MCLDMHIAGVYTCEGVLCPDRVQSRHVTYPSIYFCLHTNKSATSCGYKGCRWGWGVALLAGNEGRK